MMSLGDPGQNAWSTVAVIVLCCDLNVKVKFEVVSYCEAFERKDVL
jgi:hypothetical protein